MRTEGAIRCGIVFIAESAPTMPGRSVSSLVPYRHVVIVAAHLGLVAIAYLGAYALRFDFAIPAEEFRRFLVTLPYLLVLRMALFHRFGVFRGYWHHVGLR